MEAWQIDYDADVDVLYVSFGAPRSGVMSDVLETNDLVTLDYDERTGRMVGFDVVQLAKHGPFRIPLVAGNIEGPGQGIRPDTQWVTLRLTRPNIVEISVHGEVLFSGPVSTKGGGHYTELDMEHALGARQH